MIMIPIKHIVTTSKVTELTYRRKVGALAEIRRFRPVVWQATLNVLRLRDEEKED
jgi:hypothetical protein